MSDRTRTPLSPLANARRRWPLYAAIAALAILTLAYIDGGEEPIRPIAQDIAAPANNGTLAGNTKGGVER
ncbi:hypothetical protein [Qipengyuania sp. ASV99]|uniref:hypothetical protein n=1 Tax=Qipengyuania sp. ASV99 TaxID=3399681 RepID=UPI003A4C745D